MFRPTLEILIGIPGSGKTNYAENNINGHTKHVSSDAIRKERYGDESIQGNPEEVFSLMKERTLNLLRQGYNVIYDATNMTRKDRASIINLCPRYVKVVAVVVWASIETCIKRDAERNRTVGKDVIDKMLKRFQAPYYDEGFDSIVIYESEKVFRAQYINECFKNMDISHDNPHHSASILEHCNNASNAFIDELNREGYNCSLFHAAQYHDIGKPYVKAFINSKGEPCEIAHYYQHQCVGAWMVYGCVENDFFDAVYISWLISTHMDPFLNTKYYNNLPVFLKADVDKLHKADLEAH
jgi:predicted kinase